MHTKIQFFFILNLVPFFFFGQGTNEKGFEVKSKIGFLVILIKLAVINYGIKPIDIQQ